MVHKVDIFKNAWRNVVAGGLFAARGLSYGAMLVLSSTLGGLEAPRPSGENDGLEQRREPN